MRFKKWAVHCQANSRAEQKRIAKLLLQLSKNKLARSQVKFPADFDVALEEELMNGLGSHNVNKTICVITVEEKASSKT